MRFELHIERLVLHGGPSDRGRFADGLERELERLLTERGLPAVATDCARGHLDAGRVSLPAGSPPQALGRGVARNLYRVLKP